MQWSDELHRIHGADPLDFGGTIDDHLACVHADDRARVRSSFERAVATGRAVDEDYRVVRPDGEVRWLTMRAEPTIGWSGQVVALRGIGRDVTGPAE